MFSVNYDFCAGLSGSPMVGPDGSVIGVTARLSPEANSGTVVLRTVPVSEYDEFASCVHPEGGVDINCLMSRRFSAFHDYEGESL